MDVGLNNNIFCYNLNNAFIVSYICPTLIKFFVKPTFFKTRYVVEMAKPEADLPHFSVSVTETVILNYT